jgi:hypothetical protein
MKNRHKKMMVGKLIKQFAIFLKDRKKRQKRNQVQKASRRKNRQN